MEIHEGSGIIRGSSEENGCWRNLKTGSLKMKDKALDVWKRIKKLGKDDPRRIIHSLKVGFALTLVSLFYYSKPLYNGFGASGIWAVITVVVVFEFTVGATLSKGLNRGLGTLLAGALGIGVDYLANLSGQKGEPFILGIFVFLIATSATFSRFFPGIKARYDYGVLIFILTFSMVSVSGFRVEELVTMAHQRLSTILAGGAICVIVSIFVCPVWAGETLHNSVSSNIDKLANYLQGFGGEFFNCLELEEDGDDHQNVTNTMSSEKKDKLFLEGYKVVLNSKTTEDSMANFARWEPRHGKFRFGHPWKQYLKIGALARHTAYQIEALNVYLTPQILQNPSQLRRIIAVSCRKLSSETGKAMGVLATSMKTMTDLSSSSNLHISSAKSAINDLKDSLKAATALSSSSAASQNINNNSHSESSDLLRIIPDATVASILIEIVKSVEKISDAINELSREAHFKSLNEASICPEKENKSHSQQLLHRGSVNPFAEAEKSESECDHVVITIRETEDAEIITRKQDNNKSLLPAA